MRSEDTTNIPIELISLKIGNLVIEIERLKYENVMLKKQIETSEVEKQDSNLK